MAPSVIIAGGRDFNDEAYMDLVLRRLLIGTYYPREIVSGGARGADRAGEMWAHDHGLPIRVFNARWDEEGKAAGFIRNTRMAEHSDVLVAFWNGKSKGTKHMIDAALSKGLDVHVYRYGYEN